MTYKRYIVFRRALLALLLLVFAAFSYGGNFSIAPVSAAESDTLFSETNVLDDLLSSDDFDILLYPVNTNADPKVSVIDVVEYCYSYDSAKREHYGLYLYVYNPTLLDIDTASEFNRVLMAEAYDSDPITEQSKATSYSYFSLEFCSTVESGRYKNLFYKFRIIDKIGPDGKTIGERVNSNARRYDISGIEFSAGGTVTEYPISRTYMFSGYAKGCGPDPETEDISLESKLLETIELEVHHAFYRTGETENYHRNQLNTAYFSVPTRYFSEYGDLQTIRAEWYEYKTDYIFVSSTADDPNAYNGVFPYIGQEIGVNNDSIPWQVYTARHISPVGLKDCGLVWNYGDSILDTDVILTRIDWLLKTDKHWEDHTVSEQELYEYMDWYRENISGDNLILGRYPAELFTDSIDENRQQYLQNPAEKRGYVLMDFDADDEFNLLSYDSTHNAWQRFWDKFGRWTVDTGGGAEYAPIEVLESSDITKPQETFCNEFLMDESCYADFEVFAADAVSHDRKPVLFRFAATDYYGEAARFDSTETFGVSEEDGYVSQETVFLNFNIIQLGFQRDNKLTVIPVVASPIDIFTPLDPPLPDDPIPGVSNDGCFGLSWETLIMIAAGIVLLIILMPFLPTIASVIVWIISLPFKLIAGIVNGIKKAVNKPKKE